MVRPGSPVTASELDRRVTLQRQASPQDLSAAGEPADDWLDVEKVWASVEPLTGRELLSAKLLEAEANYRVRIRWRSDVRANWRLSFEGRTLYLTEPPREIGRRAGLEFLCSEKA